MPTSNLALWPAILNLVAECKPASVLDVGPGHGKGAVLLREYCGVGTVDAVEAWPPYAEQFKLSVLYDHLFQEDVLSWPRSPFAMYDLVLMVEVIEHMSKEDGLALLERIDCPVVICTPMKFFQNPEHVEIPPEKHRSLWSLEDFGDRVDKDASMYGGVLVRLKDRR